VISLTTSQESVLPMTEDQAHTIAVRDHAPAIETMRADVLHGLAQEPKVLPSQYLYDDRGARLFERICETAEYYPTRTEITILRQNIDAIVERIGHGALVIEPGSGSGVKTELLLENLEDPAGYVPIDVAKEQLAEVATQLDQRFPDLNVLPVCADFTRGYALPPHADSARRRVVYFPGSTIGNFTPAEAVAMLRHMSEQCDEGGGVLIGVDLKKDRAILEPAYDDAAGVSSAFALNYLVRLNRDLDADFKLEQFGYEAPYNQDKGRIEMALVSRCRQVAHIDGVGVTFEPEERVRTEYSYKYDADEFATLAEAAGLSVADVWTDPERLFSVQYLSPCPEPDQTPSHPQPA
jgi:dimethylhistidine N-methyltransferase